MKYFFVRNIIEKIHQATSAEHYNYARTVLAQSYLSTCARYTKIPSEFTSRNDR